MAMNNPFKRQPEPAVSVAMHREIVDALYLDAADSADYNEYFATGQQQRDYVNSARYHAHQGNLRTGENSDGDE